MDWQTVAIFALGLLSGATGWFLSKVVSDQKAIESGIAEFRAFVAETYVRRDDWRDALVEIRSVLVRIEGKLDGKQDRHL